LILIRPCDPFLDNQNHDGNCFDDKSCMPGKNLICRIGKCVCISTSQWNGSSCIESLGPSLSSVILSQTEVNSLFVTCGFQTSQRFSLIYRATRDSFYASSFHSKCGNLKNLLVIIQTRDNSVFGGYTSVGWTSNFFGYIYDSSAYLLSVRKNGLANPYKLIIVSPQEAIYSDPSYGPSFGINDIVVYDASNESYSSFAAPCYSYSCPQGFNSANAGNFFFWSPMSGTFQSSEIEVFQKI
jgi:hypothetical protein